MQAGNDNHPGNVGKPCPICKKPASTGFAPFCSDRCQKVDLNRWLEGTYVVPGDEIAPEASDENPDY